LEAGGLVVFPNVNSCWHYDDKVGQKYLLEAICAPLVPTWVFTSNADAEKWIGRAMWPKVFKLRCGAGSANVRLVRTRAEAQALCRQAFARGFPAISGYFADMQTRLRHAQTSRDLWKALCRAPRMMLRKLVLRRQMPRQRGYIYFQEFVPGNTYDTRITIIGDRAFGARRANRPKDFRASGSGVSFWDPAEVDNRCVDIAFRVAERLATQSLAFDFLFNSQREPMITEISYCYPPYSIHECTGHWDPQGNWHDGHIWPEEAILEDVLEACRRKTEKVR
jgi:glutathione synthase/RimK-type ligase-like ATP-grasp enzyme